jgi:hypothetical protein
MQDDCFIAGMLVGLFIGFWSAALFVFLGVL